MSSNKDDMEFYGFGRGDEVARRTASERVNNTKSEWEQSKIRRARPVRSASFADERSVVSSAERERLRLHQRPRLRDEKVRALVADGLAASGFCKHLSIEEEGLMLDAVEYYVFDPGDLVLREGDVGDYFFVVQTGRLEARVNGNLVSVLIHGENFGATALAHSAPRTQSVFCTEACGLWAVRGEEFRRLIREQAQKDASESQSFLEGLGILDAVPSSLRARVVEQSLSVVTVEQGATFLTQGELPVATYVVKTGKLNVVAGGELDASGNIVGGRLVGEVGAGAFIGGTGAMYNERNPATVVAATRCELLSLSLAKLRELLGDDLACCLERNVLLAALGRVPVIAKLPSPQRRSIGAAMSIKALGKNERCAIESCIVIVINGTVVVKHGSSPKTLNRGRIWLDDSLRALVDDGEMVDKPATPFLTEFTAGPEGCRIATLSQDELEFIFGSHGCIGLGKMTSCELDNKGSFSASRSLQLLQMLSKVPVFNTLTQEVLQQLVRDLIFRKFVKNAMVFRQGEAATNFYVISTGEVKVVKDGKPVRTLKQGACFGERALLFDEHRSAGVEVSSPEAEFWCLDRDAFKRIVKGDMLEQLQQRASFQDTGVTLNRLRQLRVIGAARFGPVRLVEDLQTRARFALKRVRLVGGNKVPEGVQRECEILREVSSTEHHFLLRMVSTIESPSSLYILTENIPGGQLSQLAQPLSQEAAQFYVASLVMVLEALHEMQIVHRDISPANIMIDAHGHIKLVDFGYAKKLSGTLLPRTFTVTGTSHYVSPEMIGGRGYGYETDVWSLGVTFYELVHGYVPFGRNYSQPSEIYVAIVQQKLTLSRSYSDMFGRALLPRILEREVTARIGSGFEGLEELKSYGFFACHASGDLFGKIAQRAIQPPFVPPAAGVYDDESSVAAQCTFSDAEELGCGTARHKEEMKALFGKFDLNGDGNISHRELGIVLRSLDSVTFNERVIKQTLEAMDKNNDKVVDFDEFLDWIYHSDSKLLGLLANRDFHD